MQQLDNLKNQLLIATPALNESYFERAVIYMLEHNIEGAMGVIINMTSDVTYKDMFEYLNLDWQAPDADDHLVLRGGPVDSEHCIIFERQDIGEERKQLNVSDDTATLTRVSERSSLDDVLMVLGYASWSASQLEQEIARNDWLIAPPSQQILFDLPYSTRWAAAASQLGVDVSCLSGEIGHG